MQIYLETKSPLTLAPSILDKLGRSCIGIALNRRHANFIIRFAKLMPLSEIDYEDGQKIITFWIGRPIERDVMESNNIFLSWDEIINFILDSD